MHTRWPQSGSGTADPDSELKQEKQKSSTLVIAKNNSRLRGLRKRLTAYFCAMSGGGDGRVCALLLPELDEMISAAMISDETM